MATKKKLLQAAAGTAAASGGAGALNVEDVFSTYLYEGNGVGKRIENGINLGDGTEEETIIHLTGDSITDSGPNSISLTNSGVVSSSSIKKFGTASLYFDANSSTRLTATDPSLNLGGGDYTVEMWLYINDASGTKGIFALSNPSDDTVYDIGMFHSSNGLTWQSRYTPVSYKSYPSNSNAITNSTWHHVALVRYNNYHYMYIDGTLQGTPVDVTGQATGWNHLKLGTHWDNAYCFTGRIDEFRVTRKALYTANFTPPTAAFSTSYTSTTGDGGLVWIKDRDRVISGRIIDTERGVTKNIISSSTGAEFTQSTVTSFNSNGFTLGNESATNASTYNLASWTFRKAPKFFDVVTYTGNGTARTISHNLGSVPGCIIIKRLNALSGWSVYHRGANGGTNPEQYILELNETSAQSDSAWMQDTAPTSTEFSLNTYDAINNNGSTYVAYLFAHNDGDGTFGPTGDQDVIRCGSVTADGSGNATVNLGFEPQWLMVKSSSSSLSGWHMLDNMRGIATGGTYQNILANSSGAEATAGSNYFEFTADGFKINAYPTGGNTDWIYIAIRRGPMAVPTAATDVFAIDEMDNSPTAPPTLYSGFPVDMAFYTNKSATSDRHISSRMIGSRLQQTNKTDAEISYTYAEWDFMDGWFSYAGALSNYYSWMWRRAPNFFDVVAYTGNGTAGRTVSHNLGVAPEMMWVKRRSTTGAWAVYHKGLNGGTNPEDYFLVLNSSQAETTGSYWNNTAPTDSVITFNGGSVANASGHTYIAYLFASVDGVSKVGSYTGNGTSQNIDCGFSTGARFVLIKRTDASGDWGLVDTERGIVAGNDNILYLNLTDAELTGYDVVDPYSSGFTVTSSFNNWNASGGTYIFYAIA